MPTLPDEAPLDGLDAYLIVVYRSFTPDIRAALGGALEPADDWVRLVWRRPHSQPHAATCRAIVQARRGALIEERAVARFPGPVGVGAIVARLLAGDSFAAGTLHARRSLIAAATLFEPRAVAADRANLPVLAGDVTVLRSLIGRVELMLPAPRPWQKLLPALREPHSGHFLLTRRAGGGLPADRSTPPFSPGQLM